MLSHAPAIALDTALGICLIQSNTALYPHPPHWPAAAKNPPPASANA